MRLIERVETHGRAYPLFGHVDSRFERVLEAFGENFRSSDEVGACAAVTFNGDTVVDLWGGYKDPSLTEPWSENTIVCMMSNAKGASSLCTHMLVERGLIDLDAPVAKYWPEFAAAGKEKLLVRHVLDHRAGLPALEDLLWPGAAYDWAAMTDALARQAPMFEPGTMPAYHTLTFGFLVGELVRRVSHRTLGTFLRDEVAEPFKIDYHIGLPPEMHPRCATFLMDPEYVRDPTYGMKGDAPTIASRAWIQLPVDESWNSAAFRSAELPAANGHGNARAMARLYGILACGGEVEGKHLIGRATLERATTEQWHAVERTLHRHHRLGLGFVLNSPQVYMGPNSRTFGSVGAGGSMAFADPEAGIGFSYAMNKMPLRPDPSRTRRLVEAIYASI
jgi:CubicO group peptidase (beta-lactamase class C family)